MASQKRVLPKVEDGRLISPAEAKRGTKRVHAETEVMWLVKRKIRQAIGGPPISVGMGLPGDLGLHEFSFAALVDNIEAYYDIDIPDSALGTVTTVGELVAIVHSVQKSTYKKLS